MVLLVMCEVILAWLVPTMPTAMKDVVAVMSIVIVAYNVFLIVIVSEISISLLVILLPDFVSSVLPTITVLVNLP